MDRLMHIYYSYRGILSLSLWIMWNKHPLQLTWYNGWYKQRCVPEWSMLARCPKRTPSYLQRTGRVIVDGSADSNNIYVGISTPTNCCECLPPQVGGRFRTWNDVIRREAVFNSGQAYLQGSWIELVSATKLMCLSCDRLATVSSCLVVCCQHLFLVLSCLMTVLSCKSESNSKPALTSDDH